MRQLGHPEIGVSGLHCTRWSELRRSSIQARALKNTEPPIETIDGSVLVAGATGWWLEVPGCDHQHATYWFCSTPQQLVTHGEG